MEAFLVSTGLVAVAEIGDKTQLLALVLGARYRKPWTIVGGILLATLLNHACAGALGGWVASALDPGALRWIVGLSFLAIAAWALKPDAADGDAPPPGRYGVLALTFVAFFLAEIGDKTQLATVALAARYAELAAVVAGTTLGMMLANTPAVFLADRFAARVPLHLVRLLAAGLFAATGIAALAGARLI